MSDACDDSDEKIMAVVEAGRERSRLALLNSTLRPIVQVLDGTRFGVCHYCESEIQPGHLFCPADTINPADSCSVMWEHERRRKEDMGK